MLMLVAGQSSAADETDMAAYLELIDTSQHYAQEDEYRTVSVLGRLRNTSAAYINSVVVEVQFFDASGRLVDTATEQRYALVVPPNDSAAFVVSTEALRGESDYASYQARVTYAKRMTPCANARNRGDKGLLTLLIKRKVCFCAWERGSLFTSPMPA